MVAVLLVACLVLAFTPAISTTSLISIFIALLFSPIVSALERKGFPKTASVSIVCGGAIGLVTLLGLWAANLIDAQWDSFRESFPLYFDLTINRLSGYENQLKAKVPFMESVHPTQSLMEWGEHTGQWFINNGAKIMGEVLTWMLIVPLFTFVLLKDGRKIQKSFFSLVPNRYFEMIFMVTTRVSTSLSDYIRAKAVEAFLVGSMVTCGLFLIDAPYAVILGLIAGITNIIPYLGPVLGAAPGILIPLLDPTHASLLWPILIVYTVANLVDMVFLFPVIVAKLVDLHPILLLTAVIIGEQYYGLVGMLISIPAAAAIKVIGEQIYQVVYTNSRKNRLSSRHFSHPDS